MTKSFDVFLSHNSKDKPAVRELAEALRARGLKVWLDDWELVPGQQWQEILEEVIETTRSSAVLVGKDGIGPWQNAEMRGCLSEFVNRKLPVIPVLLPGAPEKPKLPIFLKGFTWVDLREGLSEEGIQKLQWGVTGKRSGAISRVDLKAPPNFNSPAPSNLRSAVVSGAHSAEEINANVPLSIIRSLLAGMKHARLAVTAFILALFVVAVALFGWLLWRTPRIGLGSRPSEQQKQVAELTQAGQKALRTGDSMTAIKMFRQAEAIAPEKQKPSLHNLRLEAEKKAQMIKQFGEQERTRQHLAEAQKAINNRRFEEALIAVNSVLVLEPNNVQAQRLRNIAQAGQARLDEQVNRRHTDRQSPIVKAKPANSLTLAERSIAIVDIGYSIYAYDMAQGPDKEAVRLTLPKLYMRLGLDMPDADLLDVTRKMFSDDYDGQCLEIGLGLGVATGVGLVMIAHRGTSFEERGQQQMPGIAAKLREELSSVGILELVEVNGAKIEVEILPVLNETSDSYYQRMANLKARIKGAYRRSYGAR